MIIIFLLFSTDSETFITQQKIRNFLIKIKSLDKDVNISLLGITICFKPESEHQLVCSFTNLSVAVLKTQILLKCYVSFRSQIKVLKIHVELRF